MIRALVMGLAFAAAAIAGCAPTTSTTIVHNNSATETGLIGEDTCGMAAHRDLIGKAESAIDRATLPAAHRVICFGCMVTMDYSAQRLNVQLGPDHKVASLRCG